METPQAALPEHEPTLDEILGEPEADTPSAPPPPPELAFREVSWSRSTTTMPPWISLLMATSLGLSLVLVGVASVQLTALKKLGTELKMSRAEIEALRDEVKVQSDELARIWASVGGLKTDIEKSEEPGFPFDAMDQGSYPDEGEAPADDPNPRDVLLHGTDITLPIGTIPGGF